MSETTNQLSEETQTHRRIDLIPELLVQSAANSAARPYQTDADKTRRRDEMIKTIKANDQLQPVLVMEVNDDAGIHYEYIDGDARVAAIAKMSETSQTPLTVWCSVVSEGDMYRKSIAANLHREGTSVLQLGSIINSALERNKWTGRGRFQKVSEYLGIPQPRITEILKVYDHANPEVRQALMDGHVQALDVALKMVEAMDQVNAIDPTKGSALLQRAVEIAAERVAPVAPVVSAPVAGSDIPSDSEVPSEVSQSDNALNAPVPAESTTTPTPAVVTGADVRAAAQEQGVNAGPKSRKDIIEFFSEKDGPAYGDNESAIRQFCRYLSERWVKSDGTDRTLDKLFDVMTAQSKETKDANKAKAKAADDAAKAEAKQQADVQKALDKKKKDEQKALAAERKKKHAAKKAASNTAVPATVVPLDAPVPVQ